MKISQEEQLGQVASNLGKNFSLKNVFTVFTNLNIPPRAPRGASEILRGALLATFQELSNGNPKKNSDF